MTTRLLRSSAILPLLLTLCSCQGGGERPHLVLVVVDSLRADHLGLYGYERPTSPHIDRLGREGVVFTRASAPSSWTKPSMGSLFTARPPSEHGAVSFGQHLEPGLPTLAEQLRTAGYRTLGVTGNFVHVNETTGLARGFDGWKSIALQLPGNRGDSLLSLDAGGESPVELRAPTAEEVNREVFERLPPAEGGPLFLYVHYMEPHAGYAPPERFRRAFAGNAGEERVSSDAVVALAARAARLDAAERQRLVDLYDGEIAAVDHAIGALLDELGRRGFAANAVVVVVSDHGEEFGEHGGWFHGVNLHAESLAVPLVIHDARRPAGGTRRDEPVDLLDVPATLLALAGVAAAPGMRGRDLLGAGAVAPRDLPAELHADPRFEEHVRTRDQRVALTRWPWKVIAARDGGRTLYRLDADALEAAPLAADASGVPPDLLRDLAALERESAARDGAGTADLEARDLDALRALGYAK